PEPVVEPAADVAPATEGAVLTPAAPVPAPVAVADATDGDSYQVQEGEDVLNLSIRFSLNPSEIRELNNMGPSDELQEGQIIKLPPGTLL
ncbi:MAG: LysM peptidoglycan-binding domain-containing protein, partial [Kiritimatiellae bacterium]|nr:LysM peptidoglycan-binding domain-containing protein [Kiritimatiellia bacterium]